MKTVPEEEISKALPESARSLLIKAAKTDPATAAGESEERIFEVNYAMKRVRMMYPNFFRKGTRQ